jgi:hypothetical protein
MKNIKYARKINQALQARVQSMIMIAGFKKILLISWEKRQYNINFNKNNIFTGSGLWEKKK